MSYLQGEKVILRSLARSDLAICARWANDPEVTEYMYLGTFPASEEAMCQEYEEMVSGAQGNLTQESRAPSKVMFMILDRVSRDPIGWIGFFGINWITRVAEMRVIIGEKSYWGSGRAFESYRLVLGYGFDRLNLRRVFGGQRADNYRAFEATAKLGYVQEGLQREHFLRNGQAYDIILIGLLRDDFYALFPSMAPKPPSPPREKV